jgi:hypothetical protein
MWEIIGQRDEGWTTLFRDPESGTLWERTYPQNQMHGGGPPALEELDETSARSQYQSGS